MDCKIELRLNIGLRGDGSDWTCVRPFNISSELLEEKFWHALGLGLGKDCGSREDVEHDFRYRSVAIGRVRVRKICDLYGRRGGHRVVVLEPGSKYCGPVLDTSCLGCCEEFEF